MVFIYLDKEKYLTIKWCKPRGKPRPQVSQQTAGELTWLD